MLIDLTRKPLIVYPEICTTSVVVRTIGNENVNGIVCYWVDNPREARRRRKELKPDAQIARGRSTLFETRIPLPGTRRARGDDPYEQEEPYMPRWRQEQVAKEKRVKILPEPFEVASVFQDALSEAYGTWRAGIRIEYVEKMKRSPWVVTILDGTTSATLTTVAVSTLDPNPLIADALPLTKAVQHTVRPGNAWTRLLDDDT